MLQIYDFIVRIFVLGIQAAALFNPKARLWVEGRRNWRERLKRDFNPERSGVLWLHAASLGEFEQGRPVMEAFREQFPGWKIVLSFFSPSGYEVRKNYSGADLVCYLPADTRRNARDFLDLIQPDIAVFVKYEFWANYLFDLKKRGIPTLLVSALFRSSQPFFKVYGGFWRRMLRCFTHIFVQNESSGKLLQSIGIQNFTIAGDTRIDRVLKIAEAVPENEKMQIFLDPGSADLSRPALVAGSSWEYDEAVIFEAMAGLKRPWKLIVAPHEPSEANVERIAEQAEEAVRYSEIRRSVDPDADVLIIDNIGLLNTLYRYGRVAYIGGGFGKGIHNTLEPAAFGLPVIFGPKYEKFEEARQFVARGGAFSIQNAAELADVLTRLQDPVLYRQASEAVLRYLEENRGATAKIMAFLKTAFAGH